MATLVVLIGLPGAGKTTFGQKLVERLAISHLLGSTIVSFDQLVPLENQAALAAALEEAQDGPDRGSSSSSADRVQPHRTEWKKFRQRLLNRVEQALTTVPYDDARSSAVVLVDDNNYYRSMRYSLYQLAKKHRVGFCQFHLAGPIELHRRANASRPETSRVPDVVIEKMSSRLEPPDPALHRWERRSLTVEFLGSDRFDFEGCCLAVKASMEDPVLDEDLAEEAKAKALASRLQCSVSAVHVVDKCLRKIVGTKIERRINDQAVAAFDLASYGKLLNQVRADLLKDLREGAIYDGIGSADLVASALEAIDLAAAASDEEALMGLKETLEQIVDMRIAEKCGLDSL